MKLNRLITLFIVVWLAWAVTVPGLFGNLDRAASFGDSFGGISALFSGLALALAVYSMVLQQRQSSEFERVTLATLEQQAAAIKLIEESLKAQASAAKVGAISALIDQETQRAESLRQWGEAAGDENKYANGIRAAQRRVEGYQEKLRQHADG
ncbi:hypothetical protein LDO31_15210 [Luteimonas sp. XNQY3]|nr:DUF6082 family protein [Luteimonas sp. XNQY3]MCD9007559.1 hypothetical protein [Luteimonas sp. XNQY3]